MRRFYLLISLAVIILDQSSKYLLDKYISQSEPVKLLSFIQIVNVENRGAAFGMLKSMGNVFFIIVAVAALVFVLYLLLKGRENPWGLALILGGAAGNVIDRLTIGYVRDFIDVYYGRYHWPAFNVADSAITIGVVFVLLSAIFRPSESQAPQE